MVKWRPLALVLFLALAVFPLLAGLGQALLQSLGLMGVLKQGFTLSHWQNLLSEKSFWAALGFSFYIAFTGTFLALVLAFSFVLNQQKKMGQPGFQGFLFLPLALPALAMAFFSYQLLSGTGFLSRFLHQLGFITEPNQFSAGVGDAWGVGIIFTHVLMSTYFFTVYFTQIWRKEQLSSLLQVAENLGASPWQARWRIAISTLFNRGKSIITLYFVFALGSYEIPLLLGRSYPQMLSVFTVNKLQRFNLNDLPQAYAVAVFYALVLLLSLRLFKIKAKSL